MMGKAKKTEENPKAGKKRMSVYDRAMEKDIGYRGPLSYRHLLVVGWICISCLLISIFMRLGMKVDPATRTSLEIPVIIFESLGGLALPLFLLANFSIILDQKQSYKALIIRYSALSCLMIILFCLFVGRYAMGLTKEAAGDGRLAADEISTFLMSGTLRINLFIDLLLCTLFIFFVNYEPKKYFQGKKRIFFRLLALLPVAYEAGALAIRMLAAMDDRKLPIQIWPFLTSKPPMSFVLFIALVLHIKGRERKFLKNGKTKEEFAAYQQTNVNSLRFSIYTSLAILVTVVIDFILLLLFTVLIVYHQGTFREATETLQDEMYMKAVKAVMEVLASGIGQHIPSLLIIPAVMLFSYTRNHENKLVDTLIPAAGVVLGALICLEGGYHVLLLLIRELNTYLPQLGLF